MIQSEIDPYIKDKIEKLQQKYKAMPESSEKHLIYLQSLILILGTDQNSSADMKNTISTQKPLHLALFDQLETSKQSLLQEKLCNEVTKTLLESLESELKEENWWDSLPIIDQIIKSFRTMDLSELTLMIDEGLSRACLSKGGDLVLLFGNPGSGKSAFVEMLKPGSRPSNNFLEVVKVETTQMDEFDEEKTVEAYIVDPPEVHDDCKFEVEVANTICIYQAIKKANSVRPVIMLDFRDGEKGIENLIMSIKNMMSDLKANAEAFTIIYTGLPEGTCQRDIIEKFNDLKAHVSKEDENMKVAYEIVDAVSKEDYMSVDTKDTEKAKEILRDIMSKKAIENPSLEFKVFLPDDTFEALQLQIEKDLALIKNAIGLGKFELAAYKLYFINEIMGEIDGLKEKYSIPIQSLKELFKMDCDESCRNIFELMAGKKLLEERDILPLKEKSDKLKASKNFCLEFQVGETPSYEGTLIKLLAEMEIEIEPLDTEEEIKRAKLMIDNLLLISKFFPDGKDFYTQTMAKIKTKVVIIEEQFIEKIGQHNYEDASTLAGIMFSIGEIFGLEHSKELQLDEIISEWTMIFKKQLEEMIGLININDSTTWSHFNLLVERIAEADRYSFFEERLADIEKKVENMINSILGQTKNKLLSFAKSNIQASLQEFFNDIVILKEISVFQADAIRMNAEMVSIINGKMIELNKNLSYCLDKKHGAYNYTEMKNCIQRLKQFEWLQKNGVENYENNLKVMNSKIQIHALSYYEKFHELNLQKGNPQDYLEAYKITIDVKKMNELVEVPDVEKIITDITTSFERKKAIIIESVDEKLKSYEECDEPDFDYLQNIVKFFEKLVEEIPEDFELSSCRTKITLYINSYKLAVTENFEEAIKAINEIIISEDESTEFSDKIQIILDFYSLYANVEKYEILKFECFKDWTLEKLHNKVMSLYSAIFNQIGGKDYHLSQTCKKLIPLDSVMPDDYKFKNLEEKIESKLNGQAEQILSNISVHMRKGEFEQAALQISKISDNKPLWSSLKDLINTEMAAYIAEAKSMSETVLFSANSDNLQNYSMAVAKIIQGYEELKDYLNPKYLNESIEAYKANIAFYIGKECEKLEIAKIDDYYTKFYMAEKLAQFFKDDLQKFLIEENAKLMDKIEESQAKYIEDLESGYDSFVKLNPRKITESISNIPKAEEFRNNIINVCKSLMKSTLEDMKNNKPLFEKLECVKPIIRIFALLPLTFGAPFEEKIMDLKEIILAKEEQLKSVLKKIEDSDKSWIIDAKILSDQKAIGDLKDDIIKIVLPKITEISKNIYSKLFNGTLETSDLEEILKAHKVLGFEEINKVIGEVQKAISDEIDSLIKQIELNQYSPSFELRNIEVNLNHLINLGDILNSQEVLQCQSSADNIEVCITKILMQLSTSEQQFQDALISLDTQKLFDHMNMIRNNGILEKLQQRSILKISLLGVNDLKAMINKQIESLDLLQNKFDLKDLMLSPQRTFFCQKIANQFQFLKALTESTELQELDFSKKLHDFSNRLEILYRVNKLLAENFFQDIASDQTFTETSLAEISNGIELVYLANEHFSNLIKTDKNYSNVLEVRLEKELATILSPELREITILKAVEILIRLKRFSTFVLRFTENFNNTIENCMKSFIEIHNFDILEIACELSKDNSGFGLMLINENQSFSSVKKLFAKHSLNKSSSNILSIIDGSVSQSESSRILIAIDGTSGMPGLIKKLKSIIPTLFTSLKEKNADSKIEIQFAVYRNYDANKKYLLETSGWESEADPLRVFIDQVNPKYGLGNEAVEVALWHGLKEAKMAGLSQIILIGDAAPNTQDEIFKNRKIKGDGYWADSHFRDIPHSSVLVEELKNRNIPVNCIYMDKKAKQAFEQISQETNGLAEGLDINESDAGEKLLKIISERILGNLESKGENNESEEFASTHASVEEKTLIKTDIYAN